MCADQATKLREIAAEAFSAKAELNKVKINKKAKILAVTSGKGGVGKTNFSVNLSILLAKKGKKVALVDLDFGLANIDILLNINAPYSLEHLIKGQKTLEDVIACGPAGISVIPGGSGLSSLTELTDSQREFFLNNFYQLAMDYDYVIFDTAAGISNNVIKFVLAADEVIVVTTEEPTAITDAYALIKVLSKKRRDINFNFVVNMVKNKAKAKVTFEKIRNVVKRFLNIDIKNAGYILFDSNVREAVMKRKSFAIHYPFSPAAKSIRDVANHIMINQAEKKHLFNKFFEIFSD